MNGVAPFKYPRTPYLPWGQGGDTVITPNLLVGRSVVITEKLDGSNVLLKDGQAYPRSVNGAGRHGWLGMARKHHAWKTLEYPGLHFYGEDLYGVHAIEYDPVREDGTFRLFAVRDGDEFLPWSETVEWAARLAVDTVPVLFDGSVVNASALEALTLRLMGAPSALGLTKEGLVVRFSGGFNAGEFGKNVGKMVRDGHVQPDEAHWSRQWRPCRLLPAG